MAVLNSIPSLRRRLTLDDTDDINAAIEEALESTSDSLAAELRMPFQRNSIVDNFFVKESLDFGGTVSNRRSGTLGVLSSTSSSSTAVLKLSRGFVDSTETVTVYASSTRSQLEVAGSRTNLVTPDNYVSLDYEKGVLRISDYSLNNTYLRVEYVAGFTDDGGSPQMYIGTPSWLQELGKLTATITLHSNPVIINPKINRDERFDRLLTLTTRQIDRIMNAQARYYPMAWTHTDSTETAAP